MKDEYIRKQDVMKALDGKIIVTGRENADAVLQYMKDITNKIKSLEPADVAPVVHAHWYILEYESLTCSRCSGFYYTGCDSTTEAKERLKEGIYPKYCPNCGAKMDAQGEE